VGRDGIGDHFLNDFTAQIVDGFTDIFSFHNLPALLVNDFALIIHNVVEFQKIFPHVEITPFDFLLSLFERRTNPWMRDFLAVTQT